MGPPETRLATRIASFTCRSEVVHAVETLLAGRPAFLPLDREVAQDVPIVIELKSPDLQERVVIRARRSGDHLLDYTPLLRAEMPAEEIDALRSFLVRSAPRPSLDLPTDRGEITLRAEVASGTYRVDRKTEPAPPPGESPAPAPTEPPPRNSP